VDLTHRIDTSEIALPFGGVGHDAAKGGPGGGGGGGGGGLSFSNYTAGAVGAYNIVIEFKGSNWTQDLHDQFITAADRLVSLIIGDIPNVTVYGGGAPRTVDDILITAELKAIDGVGNILGQAGPTSIRTAGSLPATASMQFDIADAQNYQNQGLFGVIVQHEMIHSVGFGSIWSNLGLTSGSNFIGADALAQYRILTNNPNATGVPLETGGGSGTAGSHWSEAVFHDELMTGYINVTPYGSNTALDPLSRMTVASLHDLGYVTVDASTVGKPLVDDYSLS
jgi:hypothetical protein